jgi:lipopolysaccharide/colanic/teichoic acid biosynthesis glycosyltransferase
MRRIIDIAVSAIALLLLAPFLALLAVAIRIDSRGNPFYLARRVGANGAIFRMWKLRTMVDGASTLGPAITHRQDPRITHLGRTLRRTKLDELPQLVNVLLGDMTLVGPRPEAPEIVAAYDETQRKVLSVKPGITGCAQLRAGEEEERIPDSEGAEEHYVRHIMDRKIRQDLDYLRCRTFWTDAAVLVATARLVLRSTRLSSPLRTTDRRKPSWS